MLDAVHHAPALERQLLLRSVGTQSSVRPACAACHRTPLTGERVHIYEDGRMFCSLCRGHQREQPVRCERVLPGTHAVVVRPARAA